MYLKRIKLPFFDIIISSYNKELIQYINQYPIYLSDNLKDEIYITIKKVNKIDYNIDGYKILEHNFNVHKELDIKQYINNNRDIIILRVRGAELRINRDFKSKKIEFFLKGLESEVKDFIISVIETFISNMLYQYNIIPFHGAVIIMDDFCISICGNSNTGKSTTIIQLLEQGGNLLSNDLFGIDIINRKVYSLDRMIGVRISEYFPIKNFYRKFKEEHQITNGEQIYFDAQKIMGDKFILEHKLNAIFCIVGKSSENFISYRKNISFYNFSNTCILPSKLNNTNFDFLECYKEIRNKILLYEMIVPDFSLIKEIPKKYIALKEDFIDLIKKGNKTN